MKEKRMVAIKNLDQRYKIKQITCIPSFTHPPTDVHTHKTIWQFLLMTPFDMLLTTVDR